MTLLLSDSFTEGADKALGAHAPGTGGTWVQFSTPSMTVVAAEGRVRGSDAASTAVYYNSGATAADVSLAATVRRTSATASEAFPGLIVRLQTAGDNRYTAVHNGTALQIQKRVGGTTTVLASAASTLPMGADCTMELRANGQELICLWNGAAAVSATDGSVTGPGYAGIACRLGGRIDDAVAQTIAWGLAPGDGGHALSSDAAGVAVGYALAPGDGAHAARSGAAAVSVGYALGPVSAVIGMGSGAAGVTAARVLDPPADGIREMVMADARVLRVGGEARVEAPRRE